MMKNVNCQQHGIIALSAKGLVGHLGRVCPRLEALREHSDHARCRESDEEGLSGEIELVSPLSAPWHKCHALE